MGKQSPEADTYVVLGVQYLPNKPVSQGPPIRRLTSRLSQLSLRRSKSDSGSLRTKSDGSPFHQSSTVSQLDSPSHTSITDSRDGSEHHSLTEDSNDGGHVVFSLETDLTQEERSSKCESVIGEENETDCISSELEDVGRIGAIPLAESEDSSCEFVEAQEEEVHSLNLGASGTDTDDAWLRHKYPYENIVLSGGGSKGYAYIGALKAFEECGVLSQIKRVGGSSAGAICGGMLAVGCSPQEIADLFFRSPKWLFQDKQCAWFFYLPKIWKRFGINPGTRFMQIYGQHLAKKTGNPDITFKELYENHGKEFCVAVTNLTKMCSEYCHYTTTPDLPIRTAVRMSMSFPVVYEAVKYNLFGEEHLYTDGGTLDQYPIHCYDGPELELNHNLETGRNKIVNEKSIGLYLVGECAVDYRIWEGLFGVPLPYAPPYMPNTKLARGRLKDEIKNREKANPNFDVKKFLSSLVDPPVMVDGRPHMQHYRLEGDMRIRHFGQYFKASLSTIMVSQRRLHVKPEDVERTIPINCGYIGSSNYVIEPGDREFMIRCGYQHAKTFLQKTADNPQTASRSPYRGLRQPVHSFSFTGFPGVSRGVNGFPKSFSASSQPSRETIV